VKARRRRSRRPWLLLLVCAVAGGAAWWWLRPEPPPPPTSGLLPEFRERHERLHRRLEPLLEREALLQAVAADPGNVGVAIRSGLVEQLVENVAGLYLDKVSLDLPLEARINESGTVRVKTFLGRIHAGTWRVALTIHRVHGVLRARKPRVDFEGTNRVDVELPLALEQAQGRATVRFEWDSKSIANVVCRDFEITRTIEGRVLPQEYPVSGAFLLSAGADRLIAVPSFEDRPFRLRVDLVPESWGELRRALESQDRLLRCGVGIDPDTIVEKLRGVVRKGFDVRLPRSLFRPVQLPASVRHSVVVQDRTIDLSVTPSDLRTGPDTIWYSASVRSRRQRAGAHTSAGVR
jgi:hypothetical protein